VNYMSITFAPGPSQPYPRLKEFVDDAFNDGIISLSHRSDAFQSLYAATAENIKKLLDVPSDYHVWFVGSATEAMERSVQNLTEKYSHHFVSGAFGQKYYDIAITLGKKSTVEHLNVHETLDFSKVKIPKRTEMIAITFNETSSGFAHKPEHIEVLRTKFPNAMICVDVVSAVPHLSFDYSLIDCAFFSVQKGFGLPAGLGVIIASPRAAMRAKELDAKSVSIGSYHNFLQLANYEAKHNTPETPNVLGIYLLHRVVDDMLDQGIGVIRTQLDVNAEKLYQVLDGHPRFMTHVSHLKNRSRTVVVAQVSDQESLFLHLQKYDLFVGKGYKNQKNTHVRIANFPSHIDNVPTLVDALRDWR